MGELTRWDESFWTLDGDRLRLMGIPFSTRMSIVRLKSGGLWLHSPVAVTAERCAAVDSRGPVEFIVAPNKIHGVLGEHGGSARVLRLTFRNRDAARRSVERILAWDFDRVVLVHGLCVPEGGAVSSNKLSRGLASRARSSVALAHSIRLVLSIAEGVFLSAYSLAQAKL